MAIKHKQLQKRSSLEQKREARKRFALAERLEAEYMKALRMLSKQVDSIVREMAGGEFESDSLALQATLMSYSKAIEPWAVAVAARMMKRISNIDDRRWFEMSKQMGQAMQQEMQQAPTGKWLKKYLDENVALITSLPIDAARRVHKLTVQGLSTGRRAEDIRKDILQTGAVTLSRAQLIARTEVARTASGLVQSRSLHVGLTHYIWRTSEDATVRESHRHMNGKVIAWAEMPTLDDGTVCHAGQIYNCRCFPEPVLPKF